MNTTPRPVDDEELMTSLGRVMADIDPPPADLVELGRATFGLRRVDEELADLVADSLVAPAGTRAEGDAERLLSFSADDMSIDLQVIRATDGGVQLLGEIDPPSTGSVVVDQVGTGPQDVALVDGRFATRLEASGPVRVRIVPDGGPSVSVSWFSI